MMTGTPRTIALLLACAVVPLLVIAPALPAVLLLHDHGEGLHAHALTRAHDTHDHAHDGHGDDLAPLPGDDDDRQVVIEVPRTEPTRHSPRDAMMTVPTLELGAAPVAVVQPSSSEAPTTAPIPPLHGTLAVLRTSGALLI